MEPKKYEKVHIKDNQTGKISEVGEVAWGHLKSSTYTEGRKTLKRYKKATKPEIAKWEAAQAPEAKEFKKTEAKDKERQDILMGAIKKKVVTRDGDKISFIENEGDEPIIMDPKEAIKDGDLIGRISNAVKKCDKC